jgi:hypothetical protein
MKCFECFGKIYDIDVRDEQKCFNIKNKNKRYIIWRRSILMLTILCYLVVIGFTISKIVNYFDDYYDKKTKHDKEVDNLNDFKLLITDLKQYLAIDTYYIIDDLIDLYKEFIRSYKESMKRIEIYIIHQFARLLFTIISIILIGISLKYYEKSKKYTTIAWLFIFIFIFILVLIPVQLFISDVNLIGKSNEVNNKLNTIINQNYYILEKTLCSTYNVCSPTPLFDNIDYYFTYNVPVGFNIYPSILLEFYNQVTSSFVNINMDKLSVFEQYIRVTPIGINSIMNILPTSLIIIPSLFSASIIIRQLYYKISIIGYIIVITPIIYIPFIISSLVFINQICYDIFFVLCIIFFTSSFLPYVYKYDIFLQNTTKLQVRHTIKVLGNIMIGLICLSIISLVIFISTNDLFNNISDHINKYDFINYIFQFIGSYLISMLFFGDSILRMLKDIDNSYLSQYDTVSMLFN